MGVLADYTQTEVEVPEIRSYFSGYWNRTGLSYTLRIVQTARLCSPGAQDLSRQGWMEPVCVNLALICREL